MKKNIFNKLWILAGAILPFFILVSFTSSILFPTPGKEIIPIPATSSEMNFITSKIRNVEPVNYTTIHQKHSSLFNAFPSYNNEEGDFEENPNIAHSLQVSGNCVPNTVNRFTGSWHSNLYIGNNAGTNALLAWGQNMQLYITGSGTNITSPTLVTGYAGVPLEVKSSSSGGANGLSVMVLRTSTNLYVFGTAANITAITSMANFGGASLLAANSNVTAKLPAGVAITDIVQVDVSQTAFAILTSTGNIYILTKVANLQGDKAAAGNAIWHHVTLSDGITFLTGVTKMSLSSSGLLAATSINKLYYWGAPANVAGVVNTATSYNYAYDMSATIPAGKVVKDVVCLGNKTPSQSTLFLLCDDKKVYGCGTNTNGCLGINNSTTTFNQPTFVTVKGTDGLTDLQDIIKIDGDTEGDLFCMAAITTTGQVFGWGDSAAGMLGENGSTGSFSVPLTKQLFSPNPGLNFTDISVGGHFILAFYSSGSTDQYWYLGHNTGGSIGDPTNSTTFILAASPASLNSSGGITFDCSNSTTTLPLTWLSFNVQKQFSSVLINWSTATEENTTEFLIQQSTDLITWNTIGTVPSAGNSTAIEYYNFTHINPANGVNYYRLMQRDLDGHFSYSNTAKVFFNGKSNQPVINPNQIANGILNLNLDEAAIVNIYNNAGALVIKQAFSIGRHTINVNNLPKGIYLMRVGTRTEKIIIE